MSISHIRSELVGTPQTVARYAFCPDYIGCDELCGLFEIDSKTWLPIIARTSPDGRDERAIYALTSKIKSEFQKTGSFPHVVWFTG